MKGIDIFCASQASTSIFMANTDQPSSSSSAQLGGRAIDRHNPIIRDTRRIPKTNFPVIIPPCASQTPPINPKPYHLLPKTRKSHHGNSKPNDKQKAKKSSSSSKTTDDVQKKKSSHLGAKDSVFGGRRSWGNDYGGDFMIPITPPGSSRYLLGDNNGTSFDGRLLDYDPILASVPVDQSNKTLSSKLDESPSASKPSTSAPSERPSNPNQVVVLRVSLHCKGCEGKVRKHLSRMEGVTSFNIDFAAKKVTVVGDVTPLGVLASVSKVKNAQFWAPPTVVSNTIEAKV